MLLRCGPPYGEQAVALVACVGFIVFAIFSVHE